MKSLAVVVVLCLVLEALHVSGLGEFVIAAWFFWPKSEPKQPKDKTAWIYEELAEMENSR